MPREPSRGVQRDPLVRGRARPGRRPGLIPDRRGGHRPNAREDARGPRHPPGRRPHRLDHPGPAARTRAAGVEHVTAHSGRVGLASELTSRGASTTDVMLAGELEDEPDGRALLGRRDRRTRGRGAAPLSSRECRLWVPAASTTDGGEPGRWRFAHPRVNDRRVDDEGKRQRFTSRILGPSPSGGGPGVDVDHPHPGRSK